MSQGRGRTNKQDDRGSAWRMYKRFVASLYASAASDALTVVPSALLVGAISGVPRQIDLLIDTRVEDDVIHRVIVDAKCRKRKVDGGCGRACSVPYRNERTFQSGVDR